MPAHPIGHLGVVLQPTHLPLKQFDGLTLDCVLIAQANDENVSRLLNYSAHAGLIIEVCSPQASNCPAVALPSRYALAPPRRLPTRAEIDRAPAASIPMLRAM